MYINFYALYRVCDYIFFVSLIIRILLVLLQLFLSNLKNTLKFDILPTETEYHQLTKMVLQVVSIHYCAADIHVIYRKVYP